MITIRKVRAKKDLIDFIKFPQTLYRGCKHYIPPIIKDEIDTLSCENQVLNSCEAGYWLAEKEGKIVGRIGGIIKQYEDGTREARFGWLDFINEFEVVKILFATLEKWCLQKGVHTVHGPLGFVSFDRSGILVAGFDEAPTFLANYNYPYYRELIEKAGYKLEFNWVEYKIKVPDIVPEKVKKGAELIKNRYDIKPIRLKSKKELRRYAPKVLDLINEAYEGLTGFTRLQPLQFDSLYQKFTALIPLEYFSIVENKKGELVGFGLVMPDVSNAFRKMNGRFLPFGPFYLFREVKRTRVADMLLIAVKPEYRNKGITAIIFNQITPALIKNGVKWVESTKELEDNHHIQNLWNGYESRQHKKSSCFYKFINPGEPIFNLGKYTRYREMAK